MMTRSISSTLIIKFDCELIEICRNWVVALEELCETYPLFGTCPSTKLADTVEQPQFPHHCLSMGSITR